MSTKTVLYFKKDDTLKLKDCELKVIPTQLGKTPATKYLWKFGSDNVAEFTSFDWWDGLNIENLIVYPKYRKKGLSYQVLDYATKVVGCKNLAVRRKNNIAKHTYDRYGFKTTESDNNYFYMSI